jgi:hypothetical protein
MNEERGQILPWFFGRVVVNLTVVDLLLPQLRRKSKTKPFFLLIYLSHNLTLQ